MKSDFSWSPHFLRHVTRCFLGRVSFFLCCVQLFEFIKNRQSWIFLSKKYFMIREPPILVLLEKWRIWELPVLVNFLNRNRRSTFSALYLICFFLCVLLWVGGLGYLICSPSLSDPASLKDSSFAWLGSLFMLSMSILVGIYCPEQNHSVKQWWEKHYTLEQALEEPITTKRTNRQVSLLLGSSHF